jgi:hypothetical protein
MMARPIRMPAKSKYHAAPTVVDGIRFASKREAQRYGELKRLEKAGHILGVETQPQFLLWAHRFDDPLTAVPVGKYIADFRYYKPDGELVIEDVKGVSTTVYRLKKRIVEAQYGIVVREIR